MITRRHASALVVAVLVLSACGAEGDAGSEPTETTAAVEPAADPQGDWVLELGTVDGTPFPFVEGYRVTMNLHDGAIGGTAACNGYGGTYALDGATMTVGEWSITEMGCEPAVMEAEQLFISVLSRPLDLVRSDDILEVTGEGVDLVFLAIEPIPTAELIGTTWELHTLIMGEAATTVLGEPRLRLEPDGTMSGWTGCRELTGDYVVVADALRFSSLDADGICTPELADQDGFVVSVLESARIEIDGNQLTLMSTGGEGLQYRASD